ncbi:MAG: deoxyribonuclease IV [Coriobacteriia bacterium]|nr:deoxyribonuclease IV [Coriobacteriia bacterium]
MLTIGCHLSCAKGYAHMAQEALSLGANTFQFFTRNPRGCKAKPLDPADVAAFHALCAESGITRVLAHAPYTLNAAAADAHVQEFALQVFADDLVRMENTPNQLYNFHPGSHVKQGVDVGVEKVAAVLNQVLQPQQTTMVLLETMAGKGTELGRTFQELQEILRRVNLPEKVGVCLDTCHVWDAGYDIVGNLEGVLEEFDQVIGLEKLRAIHLNDSKNPCGAHKDRHERIGEGHIGFEAFARIVTHPQLAHLPFYLETPQDSLEGYAAEIARLRAAAGRK